MAKPEHLLLPAFLLAAATGVQADAFKCRTADGRVTISSTPCEDGSRTEAVHTAERISPEQRLQAEQEWERRRKVLAERDAARNVEEKQERRDGRRKLAEEESSQRTLCLQNAQQEANPQSRAELIAACNGAAPQRPVVVQQPVLVPVGPVRKTERPGWACISGKCQDFGPPARPAAGQGITGCRLVGSLMRCD